MPAVTGLPCCLLAAEDDERRGWRENMGNIVLIGMPGCGKSTVGVVLAKVMGYQFIDSDLLIQEREQRLLSEIIEAEGIDDFLQIEEEVNVRIDTDRAVISTGGSAIYGKRAMAHLQNIGLVVYLRLPCATIAERLGDLVERGITIQEGQTLQILYDERCPLYEQYAHLIVDTDGMEIKEAVRAVKCHVEQWTKG